MYDQYRLLFRQRLSPARGARPGGGSGGRSPNMDFGGFDFSDFMQPAQAGRRTADAGTGRHGAGRPAASATSSPSSSAASGEADSSRAGKGRRPGVRHEYRFLAGHQRHHGRAQHHPLRGLRHLPRHRFDRRGRSHLPAVQRHRPCQPDGRRHEVQPHLPALRRHGQAPNACPTCHGDGRITQTETVEVRIPPGARNGSRLRVPGKGNAGTMGAPPGDLYITTRWRSIPFFHREGDNIEIQCR